MHVREQGAHLWLTYETSEAIDSRHFAALIGILGYFPLTHNQNENELHFLGMKGFGCDIKQYPRLDPKTLRLLILFIFYYPECRSG